MASFQEDPKVEQLESEVIMRVKQGVGLRPKSHVFCVDLYINRTRMMK